MGCLLIVKFHHITAFLLFACENCRGKWSELFPGEKFNVRRVTWSRDVSFSIKELIRLHKTAEPGMILLFLYLNVTSVPADDLCIPVDDDWYILIYKFWLHPDISDISDIIFWLHFSLINPYVSTGYTHDDYPYVIDHRHTCRRWYIQSRYLVYDLWYFITKHGWICSQLLIIEDVYVNKEIHSRHFRVISCTKLTFNM